VDTGVSVDMHMFDAREIEDSLCNTCHECGFLYKYASKRCQGMYVYTYSTMLCGVTINSVYAINSWYGISRRPHIPNH
jgi:hypothetical protein